jgi:hypothetical protein
MIQLQVLTGAEAGKRIVASTFPFKAGRNSGNSLVLSEPGVFAEHFAISMSEEGFILQRAPEAVVTINSAPSDGGLLRNGDVIGCGLAKVQFWLGVLPQRGLRLREMASWAMVFGMGVLQFYLLIRLLEMARS